MTRARDRKGRRESQKRFTLLEGVIVFAIIAIVAAIAVPQFRKMTINGNLKAAAKDIMSDFASGRERATPENQNYSIAFDQGHNRYTVPGPANPKSPAYFARDICFTAVNFGTSPLIFQTRETTSPPEDKPISLVNGRGSSATIPIGTAGRIYVQCGLQ